MDWSRFSKKPVRLGVHSGGSRLREHRPPVRRTDEEASSSNIPSGDEKKCKQIREQVAELEAKVQPSPTPAASTPSETPTAALKKTIGTDGYESSPPPNVVAEPNKVVVSAPPTGSDAVKALSNLEMQIEKGAAVKAVEEYKGLTKSQRRAKRAKAEKAASQAAVGQLLVSYEQTLKDKGTITPENLAEHILTRNVHKRRENWYREQADRNWYRDYVNRNDITYYDDRRYLDTKASDEAADRRRADEISDRYRDSRYDTYRSSYEYDSWKRDMDRRLDDVDYWRNRGYRD